MSRRQRLLRWRVAKREREKVRRREAAFDARIARQVAQDMQIAKEAREAKAAERERIWRRFRNYEMWLA